MDERLFDVFYRSHLNGEKADVVVREMKGSIKSRYLEKGGVLNELDTYNFSGYGCAYTGYEAVVEANSPQEAIDIFFRLLKEFEGGGS